MMRIVREKAGMNSFSLEGLTLGMLMAIEYGLEDYAQTSPVAFDVQDFLSHSGLDNITAWGNDLTKQKKKR
jgi:hypothetical protein